MEKKNKVTRVQELRRSNAATPIPSKKKYKKFWNCGDQMPQLQFLAKKFIHESESIKINLRE